MAEKTQPARGMRDFLPTDVRRREYVVAEYGERLPKFFKRYQIQPVWRADRPARGRFREFYQCDVDAIGSRSVLVEAEVCAAACEVLGRLGFKNFTIRLNHREALMGVLEAAGGWGGANG